MAEKQHFQYFAFISYSRKDEKWAKWLQNKLETYRLPAAIRKDRLDVPQRIRPIFRDKTDLAGGFLQEELHKELEASRNLILICSPNSAGSEWVNKEVAHFIAMGRAGDIIPFIVDGVPHSGDPATECFPRALREMEQEPLGIDIQDLGKQEAFLKVVSTLLDVRYDQIVMRHRRRQRQNITIAGALSLLAAIALGLGIWWNTPHSKYYYNYITRWEVPEGIHELTRQELNHACCSYRITTLRGKVISVERVNSAGVPMEPLQINPTTDCAIQEFTYDDSGRLVSIDQRNAQSQLIGRKLLTYNDGGNQIAIDFRAPSNAIQAQALSADISYRSTSGTESDNKSEITRQLNTYDENGLLTITRFQRDNLGNPACDSTGVYGKAYEYTPQGQVARVHNLDVYTQRYNCRYGWATIEHTYDERGNVLSIQFYDADGNKAATENGNSLQCYTYDQWGNTLRGDYFAADGSPAYGNEGTCTEVLSYDENGFAVSLHFLDPAGEPACIRGGVHRVQVERDAQGRTTGEWYYGIDGEPVLYQENGCAGYRFVLDDQGRLVELWHLDTQGQPLYQIDGSCAIRLQYDENGYLSAKQFLDAEGQPVMNTLGYSLTRYENDANGNVLTTVYFDTQGNPVSGFDGAALEQRSYDTFGNCVIVEYFDAEGNPCISDLGYASCVWEYESGKQVSACLYDTNAMPMLGSELYYEERKEYDETGNCIRKTYYDTQGNLIDREDGYAIQEMDYDAYGNIIQWRWFDSQGNPVRPESGYFRVVDTYDSRGDMIRRERYSDPKRPQLHTTLEYTYDIYHNIILQKSYGTDGQLMHSQTNAAEARMTWDVSDNLLRWEMYGSDGKPWQWEDKTHINLYEYTYDAQGNETLIRYSHMDANGTPVCLKQEAMEYDLFGNRIRAEFLDGQGQLTNSEKGYAAIVSTYTDTSREASVEYYDKNGAPATSDGVTFRVEYEYDAAGRVSEMRSYGTDGALFREADGLVAITRYEYDFRGLVTVKTQYNERGELYAGESNTYARYEYFYDAMGDQTGLNIYDSTGALLSETVKIMVVKQVAEESAGEAAGIQVNDVLIRYGDWNFYDDTAPGVFHTLAAATNSSQSSENQVLLCRYDGSSFRFFWVTSPKTGLGISLGTTNCRTELEQVMRQTYDSWLARQ